MMINTAVKRKEIESMSGLRQSASWQALLKHYTEIKDVHMRDMFNEDKGRFEKYSLHLNNILYDFSKNRINDETIKLLLNLAKEANLPDWVEDMFQGKQINHTEHRAVL